MDPTAPSKISLCTAASHVQPHLLYLVTCSVYCLLTEDPGSNPTDAIKHVAISKKLVISIS